MLRHQASIQRSTIVRTRRDDVLDHKPMHIAKVPTIEVSRASSFFSRVNHRTNSSTSDRTSDNALHRKRCTLPRHQPFKALNFYPRVNNLTNSSTSGRTSDDELLTHNAKASTVETSRHRVSMQKHRPSYELISKRSHKASTTYSTSQSRLQSYELVNQRSHKASTSCSTQNAKLSSIEMLRHHQSRIMQRHRPSKC
jgi:hypothetical protein